MSKTVDSYRFLDFLTRKLVRAWIEREPFREPVWTPLSKPLSDATVALVSSAGVALAGDRPFDQEGERRNPWWGDPSHRVIPHDADGGDLRYYHLHMDSSHAERDMNCALPLERLADLQQLGEVGQVAPSHYSFMGYILDPTELLNESTPAMIRRMRAEQVDVALLVPF